MYGPELQERLRNNLDEIRSAGLFKGERVITSPQGAHIEVGAGQESLNLCANNYLGLASHPEITAAARQAIDDWGYGLSSVRFICGTQAPHKQLEEALIVGGPDECIRYLENMAELGINHVLFRCALDHREEALQTIRVLGTEVIPHFR